MQGWKLKLSGNLNIVPRKFLFDIGMSGAEVRGEIVRAKETLECQGQKYANAGSLGVLVDEGESFIIALPMGMFGFTPFRSSPEVWHRTGQKLDGDYKKLQLQSQQSQGYLSPFNVQESIEHLKSLPDCTGVFDSENGMRATFFEPPQGPEGYRSRYQILLRTDQEPGLVTVSIIAEGRVMPLGAKPGEAVNQAIDMAKMILDKARTEKISSWTLRVADFPDEDKVQGYEDIGHGVEHGIAWVYDPTNGTLLEGPQHQHPSILQPLMQAHGKDAWLLFLNSWRGRMDFDRGVISATIEEKNKGGGWHLSQEEPVPIVSFIDDDPPPELSALLTERFLAEKAKSPEVNVANLDNLTEDVIVKIGQALWQEAYNVQGRTIKCAGSQLIDRILHLAPGWGSATAIAFLLWMSVTQGAPEEEIQKQIETQPQAIVQQMETFEEARNSTPSPSFAVEQQESTATERQPRGVRNNNPGNIARTKDQWQGMSENQTDSRFVVFDSPEYGIRALTRILQNYQRRHKLNTVKDIISRWAPQSENNTDSYINHACKALGVQPDDTIDLNNPDVMEGLIKVIIRHENGGDYYDDSVIQRSMEMAGVRLAKAMPREPNSNQVRTFYTPQQELFQDKKHTAATKTARRKGSNTAETLAETYVIHDVDRVISDDIAVNIALQENIERHSIGLYVTNWKVGVSGYQEYWHYKPSEKKKARATHEQIIEILTQLIDDVEYRIVPHTLVKPFLRARLDNVDKEHKERSNITHYNWFLTDVEKAEDWRQTIYGNRYPHHHPNIIDDDWHEMHNQDDPRGKIEHKGQSRNKVYSVRYSTHDDKKATITTGALVAKFGKNWGKIAAELKKMGANRDEIQAHNNAFLRQFGNL